jgi:membrane protease YdiL (CAAX protease family)
VLWRVGTFGAGVLEAPLVEELTFRGAIQTSLNSTALGSRTFAGLKLGTCIAAAAFACVHLLLFAGGTPPARIAWEVLSAFPAGLVFGYIYQRTNNLWYGIILHAVGNLAGA